ncbi:hypothetical protein EV360DRAFT_85378 [Lentinula raphanica]|nr:hypothetical protein EV360DRAFT_85378 [Lentinula raphanica]
MSRSTTASRALAILLLGAAISSSGVLAAPTSMPSPEMSSNPSSNGARDLQFQSADGQAHSLSDEGLELELPQTVQLHRGGVEHPNVILRRDGHDVGLSFAGTAYLNDKDDIDPSTVSVSVDLEHAQDLRKRGNVGSMPTLNFESNEPRKPSEPVTMMESENPQQRVAISLAGQAAKVVNAAGAKELGDKLWGMYNEIHVQVEAAPELSDDSLAKLYRKYMSTVTEMVNAAEKAESLVHGVLEPLSLSNYKELLSEFDKIENEILVRPDPDGKIGDGFYLTIRERLETIAESRANKEAWRARRLELVTKYMNTVNKKVSEAHERDKRKLSSSKQFNGYCLLDYRHPSLTLPSALASTTSTSLTDAFRSTSTATLFITSTEIPSTTSATSASATSGKSR